VVNQLWARDRAALEALFTSGSRVRAGDLSAASSHRQATAELVSRAAKLLTEAGHSASEATLRKVNANLSALAAKGGFAPDPPGALRGDRDPPGFESMLEAAAPESPAERAEKPADPAELERERKRAEAAEAARLEALAKAKARAERVRLTTELADAEALLRKLGEERARQRDALAVTESKLERAEASVTELKARLDALDDG
jgi:hypothetical protein